MTPEPNRPDEREACATCGMPCTPGEFHPYAACLMFKACHNSTTVRANLDALCRDAPREGASVDTTDYGYRTTCFQHRPVEPRP